MSNKSFYYHLCKYVIFFTTIQHSECKGYFSLSIKVNNHLPKKRENEMNTYVQFNICITFNHTSSIILQINERTNEMPKSASERSYKHILWGFLRVSRELRSSFGTQICVYCSTQGDRKLTEPKLP